MYFEYFCWKFAGRLLDRVNGVLNTFLSTDLITAHWGVPFLGRTAVVAQAFPPIATHFSVAWFVSLSSVCLSQSCTLLKPLDEFGYHLV